MKPKVSLITLGVADLQASIDFYRRLGFQLYTEENIENVAFFKTADSGTLLGLYPRDKLAEDATVSAEGSGFRGFSLAHNVTSPEAVDRALKEAEGCGAAIVKPGEKVFWGGYSGYFADPDGFLWEVAHNPFMDLA